MHSISRRPEPGKEGPINSAATFTTMTAETKELFCKHSFVYNSHSRSLTILIFYLDNHVLIYLMTIILEAYVWKSSKVVQKKKNNKKPP